MIEQDPTVFEDFLTKSYARLEEDEREAQLRLQRREEERCLDANDIFPFCGGGCRVDGVQRSWVYPDNKRRGYFCWAF